MECEFQFEKRLVSNWRAENVSLVVYKLSSYEAA